MNEIIVDQLQPGEAPAAATVLAQAFLPTPNVQAIWRGQGENVRRATKTGFRIAKLERPLSRVLVARQGDRIVGVLNMVEYPHCQMSPLESLKLLPRMIMLTKGATLRAFQMQSILRKHDPREPHWHLGPVGVLPELQGQGIGSRMLERFCEFVNQQKGTAYLETDQAKNVRLYERFGFLVTGEAPVLDVRNWFMWRSPL